MWCITPDTPSEDRGRELTNLLTELGPTFIKIGQLMSTRVDILPPEVIQELARLQNEVPGFPVERAIKIIERDLGKCEALVGKKTI